MMCPVKARVPGSTTRHSQSENSPSDQAKRFSAFTRNDSTFPDSVERLFKVGERL